MRLARIFGLTAATLLATVAASSCVESLAVPKGNRVPVADARVLGMDGTSVSIDYTGAPVAVTLDGSHSVDYDGTIKSYRWLSATPRAATSGTAGRGAGGGGAGRTGMGAAVGGSGEDAGASGGAAGGGGNAAGGVSGGGGAGAGGAGAGSAGAGGAGAGGRGAGGASAAAGRGAGGSSSAGRGAAGSGTAKPVAGFARWVPDGEDEDWPDDVKQPMIELDRGTYEFTLWVTDDRGVVSEPSTVTIEVGAPADPVQACVKTVLPTVSSGCAACVCGVDDTCRAAADQSVCGKDCWDLLGCIGSMCPDYNPASGDTSCLFSMCGPFLTTGAAGAMRIGTCVSPGCLSECRSGS